MVDFFSVKNISVRANMDLAANSLLAIAHEYGGDALSGLGFARISRHDITESFAVTIVRVIRIGLQQFKDPTKMAEKYKIGCNSARLK